MARYFVHIDGNKPHRDDMGEVFADDAAAWEAALRFTRDIEDGFHAGHTWRLGVHDGTTPVYLIQITTSRYR
jgi:hypothetical protein